MPLHLALLGSRSRTKNEARKNLTVGLCLSALAFSMFKENTKKRGKKNGVVAGKSFKCLPLGYKNKQHENQI